MRMRRAACHMSWPRVVSQDCDICSPSPIAKGGKKKGERGTFAVFECHFVHACCLSLANLTALSLVIFLPQHRRAPSVATRSRIVFYFLRQLILGSINLFYSPFPCFWVRPCPINPHRTVVLRLALPTANHHDPFPLPSLLSPPFLYSVTPAPSNLRQIVYKVANRWETPLSTPPTTLASLVVCADTRLVGSCNACCLETTPYLERIGNMVLVVLTPLQLSLPLSLCFFFAQIALPVCLCHVKMRWLIGLLCALSDLPPILRGRLCPLRALHLH
jgi:hypothetical protein